MHMHVRMVGYGALHVHNPTSHLPQLPFCFRCMNLKKIIIYHSSFSPSCGWFQTAFLKISGSNHHRFCTYPRDALSHVESLFTFTNLDKQNYFHQALTHSHIAQLNTVDP